MPERKNRHAVDLAVIGAGPAGLAAAIEASRHGLSVALLDENPEPGGRIYHAVDRIMGSRPADAELFGQDYTHGAVLTEQFSQCGAEYFSGASVFRLDPDGTAWFTRDAAADTLKANSLLLATGAMERPVPVPGWTLPGVMTAGAAQLLLKGDNMIPAGAAVLMGAGPLLLLCAVQLLDAGAKVTAVVETTSRRDALRALPHLPRALLAHEYLQKGLAFGRQLKKAGVPCYTGASGLRILGGTQVKGIRFNSRGKPVALDADTVLLHNGVIPETHLSRQLGLRHQWDMTQHCWRPASDGWGRTSLDTIYCAGDGGGIGGALAAECSGRLSAIRIAENTGRLVQRDSLRLAQPWIRRRKRHLAIRPFLDTLFRPHPELLAPPGDETVVCRCEEVTAADIRQIADLGCPGPNQMKAFCRAGMGPCQGRLCQTTVTEIIAKAYGKHPSDIDALNIRPPVKPVSLAALAAMAETSGQD